MSGQKRLQDRGHYFALYLASKIKYVLTIDNYGNLQEHKTFKGFSDGERVVDCSQYFKKIESRKLCIRYENQVNENKDFEPNLNFFKDKILTNLFILEIIGYQKKSNEIY